MEASALAGFEPALRLVDNVDAAFPAHNTAVAVPILERAERIANLHGRSPHVVARVNAGVTGSPSKQAGLSYGGRYWDRTSDPFDVNEVLYR